MLLFSHFGHKKWYFRAQILVTATLGVIYGWAGQKTSPETGTKWLKSPPLTGPHQQTATGSRVPPVPLRGTSGGSYQRCSPSTKKAGQSTCFFLCSRRESNPYGHCCPQDFKSCVSTYSTTRASSCREVQNYALFLNYQKLKLVSLCTNLNLKLI